MAIPTVSANTLLKYSTRRRVVAVAFLLFGALPMAFADPGPGPPQGPPPELVEACRGKTIGDPCSFVLGGRQVEGFCGKDRNETITCPAGGVRYSLRQRIERLFPILAAAHGPLRADAAGHLEARWRRLAVRIE
jgi:hypothetical protein